INTAEAYRLFDSLASFDTIDKQLWQSLLSTGSPEKIGKYLFNSFEKIAQDLLPEIAEIKQILLKAGCYGALLSGSGSAVFGILPSRRQGEELLSQLQRFGYKDSWLVRTVDSTEIWENS
ncbi:MAG: 4-(cytidine 5'-diphospho)-2-C-methyl-D-erythritol kinase, partial [Peptococcaceae bacterium]|nr:4-(cytidine 5'-diphospho)-2-C-methyl-D-erythritol kinase [Peptococcaceae bacterium]